MQTHVHPGADRHIRLFAVLSLLIFSAVASQAQTFVQVEEGVSRSKVSERMTRRLERTAFKENAYHLRTVRSEADKVAVASANHRVVKSAYVDQANWLDAFAPGSENPNGVVVAQSGVRDFTPATSGLDQRNVVKNAAAPNAITDLSVGNVGYYDVNLSWTAPADSENNAVAYYDIRASTEPIDEESFEWATQYEIMPPTPPDPGSYQYVLVDNLDPGTVFYFAIRSYDLEYNASPISNVVSARTIMPATIDVVVSPFVSNLTTGQEDIRTFTVRNIGDDGLIIGLAFVADEPFITFDSETGLTVPPHDSLVVSFRFQAYLLGGSYDGELFIWTNDQNQLEVRIPVTLNVTENGHPITVIEPASFDFGNSWIGQTRSASIRIANNGSEPLVISDAYSDNADFDVHFDGEVVVPSFTEVFFAVTGSPHNPGVSSGTIAWTTNDPDNPILSLPVSINGAESPMVSVSPSELTVEIYSNQTEERRLTLSNTGGVSTEVGLRIRHASDSTISVTDTSFLTPRRVLIITPDRNIGGMIFLFSEYPEIEITTIWPETLFDWPQYKTLSYDVLLIENDSPWSVSGYDPDEIGDKLAEYIDLGAKVVIFQHTDSHLDEYRIGGRFASEYYSPFSQSSGTTSTSANLGVVYDAGLALFENFGELPYIGEIDEVGLNPGATRLADWSTGQPLAAIRGNVLALNMPLTYHGAILRLGRSAINLLSGNDFVYFPQQTISAVDPGAGTPVQVMFRSRDLPEGEYHAIIDVMYEGPESPIISVPVTMQVKGAEFESNLESIYAEVTKGGTSTNTITITNRSDQSHPFEIHAVENTAQSESALGPVGGTVYATDFEDFQPGDISQLGWSGYGAVVETSQPYSGARHIRMNIDGTPDLKIVSPVVAINDKPFTSMSLKIRAEGGYYAATLDLLPGSGGKSPTSILIDGYRIWATVDEGYGWANKEVDYVPEDYFDLTIEVGKYDHQITIYINGERVFQDRGFAGDFTGFSLTSGEGTEGIIDIDDFQILDGKRYPESVDFVSVTPVSGTIAPGATQEFTVVLNSAGLDAGDYTGKIGYFADKDAVLIPIHLSVVDNHAPEIDSVADVSMVETEFHSLVLTASDPDGEEVTLSITNLPRFVKLKSSESGKAVYKVLPAIRDAGEYLLEVKAMDAQGATSTLTFVLTVTRYGVDSFTLIDSRTNKELKTFTNHIEFARSDPNLKYYRLRANTNPRRVGSVVFKIDGKKESSTKSPPYFLGNKNTIKNLKPGKHTLLAQAFTDKNGKGKAGKSLKATITITNPPAKDCPDDKHKHKDKDKDRGKDKDKNNDKDKFKERATLSLSVKPNPVAHELTISLSGAAEGEVRIVIVDAMGYQVYSVRDKISRLTRHSVDLSALGLRNGTYYVQVIDNSGERTTVRIVKR